MIMKDPLLTTSPTSRRSSNNGNGRMILAISLTLTAFLIEVYTNNSRIAILNLNLHSIFRIPSISISLPSPTILSIIIICLTILLAIIHIIRTLQAKVFRSSIPGLPATPHANFLFGHYGRLIHTSTHHSLFHSSATPSGITSLWGPNFKICASALKSAHVRLILRHTPSRDFSSFIARHGRKTLGKDSLILIEGGKEWRRKRNVVQQAFTVGAIENGRDAVGECALEMVQWLMNKKHGSECNGHKCLMDKETGKERNVICVDVEKFFKLFSLDVFGRVTMDYDFECFKKGTAATTSITNNNNENNNNKTKTCTCFTSPPEAAAFEYLERDIGVRAHPKHLINPFSQLYWLPTKHNREYHANSKLVKTLMEGVIGVKLEEYLGRVQQTKKKKQEEEDKQQQQSDGIEEDEEEEENNMITMMLRSVIEEQYRNESKEKNQQQQQQHHHSLNSTNASSFHNTTTSSSSSCPFSSSSSTTSFQESNFHNNNNNIPTTTMMSKSDRAQIIENVSHILHTLLVAGYETTAVSLSYTMYCLSKHPRCQDRACEEARRVLSTSLDTTNNNNKFDEDALPYCKAIILESLRIHVPIIFTTRVSAKNLTFDTDDHGGKVTIPKDTRFILNPTIIHLEERNFDRAEEFLPERWVRWENGKGWVDRDFEEEEMMMNANLAEDDNIASSAAADDVDDDDAATSPSPPSLSEKYTAENKQADTISAANPQSFFAFSDGARNCIGRRLAIMESTIFIAVLLRDMCVDLAEKEGYELVKERRFVIVAPKNLHIAFWKRDDCE